MVLLDGQVGALHGGFSCYCSTFYQAFKLPNHWGQSSSEKGLQGGPHNHTIAGLAATTPEYKAYQEQVLRNCSKFAKSLVEKCYELVSGGTENHLVLVNLKNKGIDVSRVEKVLELVHIVANKNTIPGNVSIMGFVEEDFAKVVNFFDTADFLGTVQTSAGIRFLKICTQ
uniref:Serine hydroxymethyltransferase-like domain-containing protein n=1 Tax=Nelumbo nucifera TaxID=4432 RepID=A0A822Z8N4_NELNU|nr:TPA_asm: hypothetical protein HUJ06_015735 [Nelumbo nucifera]